MGEIKVYHARLEDWFFLNGCLWGTVYEDTTKRFPDGSEIRTSYIDNFKNQKTTAKLKEGGTVKTHNKTIYLLGKRGQDVN